MEKGYKKTITCIPELGNDGWYRVIIDTYYYMGSNFTLSEKAEKVTGVKWEAFGCFMDTCCIATKEDTDSFTMEIDWMVDEERS